MSPDEANTERLRSGLEEFNRTGELRLDFFASDFEIHQAESIVDTAGVFRGESALHEVLAELEEAFEDLGFEAERYAQAPGGEVVVIVRVHGRGRGSGIKIDNQIAHVWTFRDEEAVRLMVYEEPAEALEAMGIEG